MADQIVFGTGGWRAVIADTFTKANVCRLAQGLAERIQHEEVADRPVVIGYDQRFLSPEFAGGPRRPWRPTASTSTSSTVPPPPR